MADLVPMSQAATTSLVTTLQNTDLFALAREDNTSETGYRSKVARVDGMAKKVVNETDYSQLQTTDKKIIGAINEVNTKASQFDNMTANASGSIATFNNGGADIPVKSFECEIVAQQASGTPTPSSPLPISGFSQADIPVCGLNFFDEEMEVGTLNNSTGATEIDANKMRSVNFIPIKPNTTYGVYNNTGVNLYIYSYGVDKSFIAFDNTGMVTGSTFTTGASTYYIKFRTQNNPSYSNNISINYPSSDTQYHAYKGNIYTVEFGQTIYGGRLIYSNGEWAIEADKAMKLISDLDWSYDSDSTRFASGDLSGIIEPAESTSIPLEGLSCECYQLSVASSSQQVDLSIAVNTNGTILLKDTNYTDVTSLLSAVGNYKIVYPLAAPVIIPITSSTRVKTIRGLNNIYSNTGDVSLEYFTDKADSLAELIKAFVL